MLVHGEVTGRGDWRVMGTTRIGTSKKDRLKILAAVFIRDDTVLLIDSKHKLHSYNI